MNYDHLLESLDVDKAKRLLNARTKSITALRKIEDEKAPTEPIGLA